MAIESRGLFSCATRIVAAAFHSRAAISSGSAASIRERRLIERTAVYTYITRGVARISKGGFPARVRLHTRMCTAQQSMRIERYVAQLRVGNGTEHDLRSLPQ